MSEFIKEKIISGYPHIISFDCILKIIEQMKKFICKINIGEEQGTGFFRKIPFPNKDNMLHVLITNNHLINKDLLNKTDGNISFKIRDNKNKKNLNLNDRKKYTDEKYDITIIEIKKEDKINNYMELDDKIIDDIINNEDELDEYVDKTIYIIQYPEGQLSVSYGIIDNIYEDIKYNFSHRCSTRGGSSGSPILNINNKIIGIHKESNNVFNRGTFLNYPIKEFINQYFYCNNNNINKLEKENKSIINLNNILKAKKEIYSSNIKNQGLIKFNKNKINLILDKIFKVTKNEKKEIKTPFYINLNDLNLKSICKLKIETEEGIKYGNSFLFKFPIEQEYFYCLITNENVIINNKIQNNSKLYIHYDKEYKKEILILNKNERYIKSFIDIGLDITVIEILDKDNISKDYFLWNESDSINYNELINNEIYLPQYEKGKKLVYTEGIIEEINKYKFKYLANKKEGISGYPIFLKDSIAVIGIHKASDVNKKENYGDFLYPVINIIKEDINKKRKNSIYINGKYIWDDGKYYIGEYKNNNIPNGEGIKYYSNGNILYEGDFIAGKFEGNGKYIWEDGEYYIGEWKNDLRNGRGIKYYPNGKIKYEGDWINDIFEGNGKYIWEDGVYYLGQFKNGSRNGKGTMFYSNGKEKYVGDFINDKEEGNGKCFYDNGDYYIGEYKNCLRNGKGTEYYSNGKIMYEGDFVDGKYEGKGKYIWKNDDYYIGEYKNGLRNGKGTEYYSNGNIIYEGDFINDKYEGYGTFIWENDEYYIGEYKNGLRNGKGTEYYSNGKIMYEGDFIKGKYDGNGKYIWENGKYYIGQFKYGLRNGKGIFYHSNGKIKWEGDWVKDIFIGN